MNRSKPHYVDFASAFCLQVLESLLRGRETVVFQEMLPGDDELSLRTERGHHVAEIAMEVTQEQERRMMAIDEPGGPGEWQSLHIFYTAKARPLVKECVRPLIADLRGRGLVENYFFIHYWLEGPHVRLRLKPVSAAATDEVRERTEEAIRSFLKVRPSLYEVKDDFFVNLHNTLFELEFSAEEKDRYTGSDGRMRQRPNNSFSYETYEPEYAKYGGPAGVALAEWHFRHSTDLVLEAVQKLNMHLRTVALGLATQLMMVMATAFLEDERVMREYLQRYHDFWRRAFMETALIRDNEYDEAYRRMSSSVIANRFTTIRAAMAADSTDFLPGLTRTWAVHCRELRDRVVDLASQGQLVFPFWDGTGEPAPVEPRAAIDRLLSPYLHMTNNRLEVNLSDEAYLAFLLVKALDEAVEPVS